MKRRLQILFILLGVLFTVSNGLYAGTTGKIAGKITDAETNEPLPGVNVIVEGTQTGAATDLQGNYQILNLPPRTYTLIVSMIGYTNQRIENVQVRIDLTTTQNIKLSQTVLESGEEVTIVAERPLVQMDMTGSLSTVSAE
ncbi:carboxypeptidase-like regulatory domain-containing protein, partial [candidate division KSB1 bacterium]|nr:carboxypeptidase-like regulatory domain-containing protein [candidate division KSB1 bacterium]